MPMCRRSIVVAGMGGEPLALDDVGDLAAGEPSTRMLASRRNNVMVTLRSITLATSRLVVTSGSVAVRLADGTVLQRRAALPGVALHPGASDTTHPEDLRLCDAALAEVFEILGKRWNGLLLAGALATGPSRSRGSPVGCRD